MLVWHVVASWWLVGVGVTVTLVQYPTFRFVAPDRFAAFHARHASGMGVVVALPWVAQGVTAVGLLLSGTRVVQLVAVASAIAVVLTVAAVIPQHARLAAGFDDTAYRKLLLWDRVRLAAFVAHALFATAVFVSL
jgi:hypothetical protein